MRSAEPACHRLVPGSRHRLADRLSPLVQHTGEPQDVKYGEAEMRRWYRELDLLPGGIEQIIPADSALEATVIRLTADAGLDRGA